MFLRRKRDNSRSNDSPPGAGRLAPAEWPGFVRALYRAVLRRDADPAGLDHALALMKNGMGATELVDEFAASDEFLRSAYALQSLPGHRAPPPDDSLQPLNEALEHHRPISRSLFDSAWETLADCPAHAVVGQAEYCRQHRERFYCLFNAVALLTRDQPRARVLEIGVSAASNLYAQFFPGHQLEVLDRPTAEDYAGFTRTRCEQIAGVSAVHSIDLTDPESLHALQGRFDLVVFTEVMQVLPANPVEIMRALINCLTPGGSLYYSTANFFARSRLDALAEGQNPQPFYPAGDGNWDSHHCYRFYTLAELDSIVREADGRSAALFAQALNPETEAELPAEHRETLVGVARRADAPALDPERKQEIVLHIGSDKAGSTAIQAHLYGNRDWLLARDIYVPQSFLGKDNGHAALLESLSPDKLAQLQAELQGPGKLYTRVCLSWEGSHFLRDDELALLATAFEGHPVRIVFYLREQAQAIQSGLLQEIKSRRRDVNLQREAAALPMPANRDYYRTIKRWEAAFPGLRTDVVYFDREAFPKGNVVQDFIARLGCEDTSGFEFYSRDLNTSLDLASALALQSLRDVGDYSDRDWKYLVDEVLLQQQLAGMGRRHFLRPEQVDAVRQHYAGSNRALVEEYGVSERLLSGVAVADCAVESPFGEDLDEAVAARLAAVRDPARHAPLFSGFTRLPELRQYLGEGWRIEGEAGAWFSSKRAELRLRALITGILPCHRRIILKLRGYYADSETGTTRVLVNDRDLGMLRLGQADIELPVEALPADLHLSVVFAPGTGANEAFCLQAINLLAME